MKDGRIAEKGTHDELLSQKGIYETLYNSQFVSRRNNRKLKIAKRLYKRLAVFLYIKNHSIVCILLNSNAFSVPKIFRFKSFEYFQR